MSRFYRPSRESRRHVLVIVAAVFASQAVLFAGCVGGLFALAAVVPQKPKDPDEVTVVDAKYDPASGFLRVTLVGAATANPNLTYHVAATATYSTTTWGRGSRSGEGKVHTKCPQSVTLSPGGKQVIEWWVEDDRRDRFKTSTFNREVSVRTAGEREVSNKFSW